MVALTIHQIKDIVDYLYETAGPNLDDPLGYVVRANWRTTLREILSDICGNTDGSELITIINEMKEKGIWKEE